MSDERAMPNPYPWPTDPPPERAILLDLIADLRYAGSEIWDHYGQFSCIPATPVKAAADRAEARLDELNGVIE